MLDKATNLIADASCPSDYTAAFLDGTQPTGTCDHPNGDQRNMFQRIFGLGGDKNAPPLPAAAPANVVQPRALPGTNPGEDVNAEQGTTPPPQKKKHGFFGRLFGGSDNNDKQQSPPNNEQAPQQ